MRYAHLHVECQFFFIFDQVSWSKFPSKYIQNYVFLSGFIRRVKQAQTFNFWSSTFEKISKILKNLKCFGLFYDIALFFLALKILQSCRKKGCFYEVSAFFKDYSSSLFLRISISLHPTRHTIGQ
jgi:hypothetical protein